MEFLDSLEPWQRWAIVLGVIATGLSIAGRVWRWPLVRGCVNLGRRFILWGFRRALIHILASDRSEARSHLVYLLEPEINRLERLEEQLTTLKQSMHGLSEMVYSDRNVIPERISKLEHAIEGALFDIRETMNVVLGAVLGDEPTRNRMREKREREHRRSESNRGER